jgi:hypothetical protein
MTRFGHVSRSLQPLKRYRRTSQSVNNGAAVKVIQEKERATGI